LLSGLGYGIEVTSINFARRAKAERAFYPNTLSWERSARKSAVLALAKGSEAP
jgi:hypothetical protein